MGGRGVYERWGGMRGGVGAGLLVGALVVIGTGGCAEPPEPTPVGLTGGWETAGCGLARTPQSVTVAGQTVPTTPASLMAAMGRIERGGSRDYADSFAGVQVDEQQVRAIVYRVPSAAFDDFIRLSAEDTCIVVRDSLHSLKALTALHDRVVADLPDWTAKGIRISTVGARPDGFGVEVGTQDLDRARTELPARYGAQAPLIFIEQGPVKPLGR
jgi:hypothetical protein